MYQVRAYWDADARVWHGASADLPGLSVQAPTMEDLIVDVRESILDLVPSVDQWRSCREPIAISFIASRSERVERRH
jgi:predicted RNase H-like HicB family nuclease